MFVKICSCRTPEAVDAAVAAGASAVGFIFVPSVRRFVDPLSARDLTARVPDGIWRVGVFLDQAPEEIAAVARAAAVDTVQLHGNEPPGVAAALRRQGWRVIQAWNGRGAMPQTADLVLVEPHAGQPGGRGQTWEWSSVRDLPVLLSGGLTPGNVREALEAVRPFGVDVSSGVETDGAKDPDKIRAFCDAVRRWEDERRSA